MIEESECKEKIVLMLLGCSSVGKTSFIIRYTENIFQELRLSTFGIDFMTKIIVFKGKQYKLIFYDTSGQEKYKSMAVNMIKNSDCILMMYDITDKKSYDSINEWMKSVKEAKGDDCPMILLGNKMDLEDEREITEEEGINLANEFGIEFFETSNKNNINIKEAIDSILNTLIEKREKDSDTIISSSKLSINKIKKKPQGTACC